MAFPLSRPEFLKLLSSNAAISKVPFVRTGIRSQAKMLNKLLIQRLSVRIIPG
jgi:hypothetical protein